MRKIIPFIVFCAIVAGVIYTPVAMSAENRVYAPVVQQVRDAKDFCTNATSYMLLVSSYGTVQSVPARAEREFIWVVNKSTHDVYMAFTPTGISTLKDYGVVLEGNDTTSANERSDWKNEWYQGALYFSIDANYGGYYTTKSTVTIVEIFR